MMNNHKKMLTALSTFFVGVVAMSVVWAAFGDKSTILGSTFSTGSADLKILINPAAPAIGENIADETPGPDFVGIIPNWTQDYPIALYNNGTNTMTITSNANYETVNDPDDLRTYIYVEPIEWFDRNFNGTVEADEEGVSYGKKTITKWKTEGFNFGTTGPGEIKKLILRFSTDTLSETKQGKSGIFDFEFDSVI